MQEGVEKIIDDATSIDGDGFENMDIVTKSLRNYRNIFFYFHLIILQFRL